MKQYPIAITEIERYLAEERKRHKELKSRQKKSFNPELMFDKFYLEINNHDTA